MVLFRFDLLYLLNGNLCAHCRFPGCRINWMDEIDDNGHGCVRGGGGGGCVA